MLTSKDFKPKFLVVKNTNIRVQKSTPPITAASASHADRCNTALAIMCSIEADPVNEAEWFDRTFRPERNLIHPSEAFLHGIKRLSPAIHFNTFNADIARSRRIAKQQQDQASAKKRKAALVAPTVAMKAALNPKKLPAGSKATDDESRFLSRGKENKRQDALALKRREEKKAKNDMRGDTENAIPRKKRRREQRVGDSL